MRCALRSIGWFWMALAVPALPGTLAGCQPPESRHQGEIPAGDASADDDSPIVCPCRRGGEGIQGFDAVDSLPIR